MRLGDFAYQRVTVTTQQIDEGNGSARLGCSLVLVGRNPYVLQGHTLYYGRAIGADQMMAEIILDIACRFGWQYPCIESK